MTSVSTALVQPRTRPAATPATPLPSPSPGTWRHPKFSEIAKRQSASTLSDRNVKVALSNTVALVSSLIFRSFIHSSLVNVASVFNLPDASTIATYLLLLFRLYLLLNISLALRPVFPYLRTVDEMSDIPLTPSQRALLGLNPSTSSTPASGGYITPPRYRRSSGSFTSSTAPNTPLSNRRSISANYSGSPHSTSRNTLGFSASNPSPFRTTQRTASGSPFSPSASPLLQKAIAQGSREAVDMQNFGASTSSFGLARSQSVTERGSRVRREGSRDSAELPGTPSPTGFGGVKREPGLNYKWLYERGRGLPKSETMNY